MIIHILPNYLTERASFLSRTIKSRIIGTYSHFGHPLFVRNLPIIGRKDVKLFLPFMIFSYIDMWPRVTKMWDNVSRKWDSNMIAFLMFISYS